MSGLIVKCQRGEEIFLDHVGYFADDLEEAGDRLMRLGFQVSSINVQYNKDAVDGFSRFTKRDAVKVGGFHAIALERGRILFASAERVAAALPGFAPVNMPYIVGQGIKSADLVATKQMLRHAGTRPIISNDDLVCVGPADALGAYLLFHNVRVAHPWASLAQGAAC